MDENTAEELKSTSGIHHPFPAGFCEDAFWDLSLTWYTASPILTQCFCQTVLVWIPAGFAWVMLPLQLRRIRSSRFRTGRKPQWTWSTLMKLVLALFVMLLSVAELMYCLAYWAPTGRHSVPVVDLVAPAVRCATMILIVGYIVTDKKSAMSSSGPLFFFWLLLLICEAVTFWQSMDLRLRGGMPHGFLFFARLIWLPMAVVQLVLSCFGVRSYFPAPTKARTNPEEYASFPNRLTFWWFTGMGYKGWKRPLEQKDMYDLALKDTANVAVTALQTSWDSEVQRLTKSDNSTPPRPSFLWVVLKTYWLPLLGTCLMRLLSDLLIFVTPQLLQLLIHFVDNKSEEAWKGYLYTFGMLIGTIMQTIILNYYLKECFRLGMHTKAGIMAIIYRKALRISSEVKQGSSVGEMVNLISIDAQRFVDFAGFVHVLWSAPLQMGLAIFFLYRLFGLYPAIAALCGIVITLPLNAYTFSLVGMLQEVQMKEKDGRIKLMNEILNGIKVLKLYAWEIPFQDQILKIRNRELSLLKRAANIGVVSYVSWVMSPFTVALATFTTFILIDDKNRLNSENVFVALSLINVLRVPLSLLAPAVLLTIQVGVAVKRLTKFMNHGELNPDNVQMLPDESDNALVISDGNFAWNKTDGICLKNVNLKVPDGKLVAVVGQVGSGKSSLCSAMIGLMEKMTGKVGIKGTIAYVPQQAWIQNLTVKENILFGKEMRPDYYQQVIESCALITDLNSLPASDDTEIGERGANMSGGQRQRISLARAAYSDADVYIFDDPLSAVDAHVGKHIFEHVIGPNGILKGKTRILVTHGIGFLPQTDQIVVVSDGKISETGTYRELLRNNGAFAEFLRTYVTEAIDEDDEDDPEVFAVKEEILKRVGSQSSIVQRKPSVTSRTSLRQVREVFKRSASRISEVKKEDLPKKPVAGVIETGEKGRLVEEERAETGIVKWDVYFMFMKQMSYRATAAFVTLYACYTALGMGSNFWLSDWALDLENTTNSFTSSDKEHKEFRLGVYGGIGLAQAVCGLAYALIFASARVRAGKKLHEGLLFRIMKAPMSFFDTTPVGRIVNRFSRDIDSVDILVPGNLDFWLYCFFGVISTVVVVCISTPYFAILVVPLGAFYFFMQRFFISTSRQLKRLESISRSPVFSHFQESVAGSGVILATKQSQRFILDNERLVDVHNSSFYLNIIASRWISVRLEFLGIFVTFFASLFAVIGRDRESWAVQSDEIGLTISYTLSVNVLLNWLLWISSELESSIVAVERIKDYTEVPQELGWINPNSRPAPGWPENGCVDFKDYQTRYRPGLDLVLRGLTSHINSGEKIGIVGRTGAGKSSMTLALFRLIEAAGGAIEIDNVDIASLGLHDVRSRITILPQEPVLFSGTLRMNLDPYTRHTDEEIWSALEHSHLKRSISALPDGIDHTVVDGGENFSVGQRQLICLARALLRKTKILVLDEATAAIDLHTDGLIQQTIRDKFADCTILTIAHRINTIMDSTRIMVLDAGRIQEFASPAELLKDHNSLFYSLAKAANLVP